ncbi:MAG: right-handed parallel beta-helix repeat-containing protein, partial [Candidatus Kariarchaeaceae archaeon]
MKSKNRKTVFLLVIGLVFPLILNHNLKNSFEFKSIQFNEENGIKGLKTSGVYTGIVIDDLLRSNTTTTGNWSWAVKQPWCEGSGTLLDPYIIEGHTWNMSLTIDGLKINNSHNKHFTVKNCTFKWNELTNTIPMTGIHLLNTTHGLITGNLIYHLGYGIVLEYCENIEITGNTIYDHIDGISLVKSNLNNIKENSANNNSNSGIYLNYGDNNNITGNTVNHNGGNGIYLHAVTHHLLNNYISNNTVNYNGGNGIYLHPFNFDIINTSILENTANKNTENGIYLRQGDGNCNTNYISGNTVNNNTSGINLEFSNSNTISGNIANNNDDHGICFNDGCNDNIISGNTASVNIQHGIYLYGSNNNTILENTANNNYNGIYLI